MASIPEPVSNLVPIQTVSKDKYRDCLASFLRDVDFQRPPPYSPDASLEQLALERCLQIGKQQGLAEERMPTIAKLASASAFWCYPYHEREIQLLIALYTAYFFMLEDLGQEFLESIRGFRRNILQNGKQTPVFHAFIGLFDKFDQHYPIFNVDMMYKGLLDFTSAAAFEFDMNGFLDVHPSAPNLADYLRMKTGIPAPYICFITPTAVFPEPRQLQLFIQAIPDLLYISNGTNDLFSFYKESILSTDHINFVHNYAVSHQITAQQALDELSSRLVQCVRNVRATVSGDHLLLKYVDGFINGNIGFHLNLPRYHLTDLGMPLVDEVANM